MDLLDYIDSTNIDYCYDFEQQLTHSFDPAFSGKRPNSEFPEAKRQRLDLDEYESFEVDDFVKLLDGYINTKESTDIPSLLNEKENIPIQENNSENLQTVDGLNNTVEYSLTGESEVSDKSNSGSTGRQARQLKVVGRPLREKPQEPKKVRRPVVPNYEKPQEDVAIQKQEILKEPLTIQPKNITLSLKMVEVDKTKDTKPCIQTNIIAGDIRPQHLKLKFIDPQTPALVADPQSRNKIICKPWNPTIQMAQNHMVNIPRPTQEVALSAPHGVKETIVFDPNQVTLKKAKKENFNNPNLVMPCKNLKIVSAPPQKTLQVGGGQGQPAVQQPVKSVATKHNVVFRTNANQPSEPQKIFTLVPFQPARGNVSSETNKTVKTLAPVEKPRKIILKTRNEEDIVSAEDFARFLLSNRL